MRLLDCAHGVGGGNLDLSVDRWRTVVLDHLTVSSGHRLVGPTGLLLHFIWRTNRFVLKFSFAVLMQSLSGRCRRCLSDGLGGFVFLYSLDFASEVRVDRWSL